MASEPKLLQMRIHGLTKVDLASIGDVGDRPSLQLDEPNAPTTFTAKPSGRFSFGGTFGQHRSAIAGVIIGALLVGISTASPPVHAERIVHPAAQVVVADDHATEKQELKTKINALVKERFKGDFGEAFRHYDRGGLDRALDKDDLYRLLDDAGIGNFVTRGIWVSELVKYFDQLPGAKKNGQLDWHELQSALA